MFSRWLKRLSPQHREKEMELEQASGRVSLAIARYKNMSREIQEEIERNKFARFLVYDKGDHYHGGN